MDRAFTTMDRPPGARLRWWQEVLSDVYYNVEVDSAHRDALYGRIVEHDIGCASVTRFAADQQRVLRSRKRIAMDSEDSFVLVMPTNQPLFYSQAGRSGYQPAGSYVLVNTQSFYELACPDGFANITVKLPAARVRQRLPHAEDHCASAYPADPRLAAVVRDYAVWLVGQRQALSAPLADSLSEQLLDLLVALLESERAEDRDGTSSAAAGLRRRISAYLNEHLTEPELSPTRVAEAFGISTSYLHRLFRPAGMTLGRWIAANRLQRGYEMLTLPRHDRRSIAEIAYAVGFTSQAHFSEAFRRQFGTSPSQARRRARRGLPGAAPKAWGSR